MKIGTPEGGGVGEQSFVGAARERELQELRDASLERQEYEQTPAAQEERENKIGQFMADFDRMALSRTDEQVDQLIRQSNTDVSEGSIRGEAYERWKAQRNVVDLDSHREGNQAA